MDFEKLAILYEQLENTSSGNKMREILSDFFKEVPKDEISIVAYLTLGRLASEYENVVLQLAEKSLLKSIAMAGGTDLSKVQKAMQESGDAGSTAEKILQKKPQTLVPVGKLTIHELFEKLHKITEMEGEGSQDQKSNIVVSLLQKVSAKGARYLIRIILGTLRMGVAEMTVLDSLAIAYTGEKKNKEILEAAYNVCPDVGIIADTIAHKGLKGLQQIGVKVGVPIKMMLAQRISSLEELPERIPGKVAVEGKYDGERIQAHKHKGKMTLFSRKLENITSQFPDVVEYLGKLDTKEFVVEGEVIAIDKEGKPLAFQTLMQRKRKYDVEEYIKKVPVQLKLFDILYLDGKSYLDESQVVRAATLEKIVTKTKHLTLTDKIITDDISVINDFFQEMLEAGYEGVMIKSLADDSSYQAGTRGWHWVKWKREYVKEMHDTFDFVIVGAFHGKGKRSGTYGALLCAAYNKKDDTFETVCKLGTGLTDAVLEEIPKMMLKYKVTRRPARVVIKKEMEPDVWFEPVVVVEVLGAELTKSPFHTAGVALRFPRFIQFRDNKKAEEATTTKEVLEIGGK